MTAEALRALARRLRDGEQYVDACDEAADMLERIARLGESARVEATDPRSRVVHPWIELTASERIALLCCLCGRDIGPQPVQATVMVPATPHASRIGQACAECIRLPALLLANVVEEHIEQLSDLGVDLLQISKLLRAGQFRRPSLQDWQSANAAYFKTRD